MNIKIIRMNKDIELPRRENHDDAGADLFASIDQKIIVKPNEIVKVPNGIKIEIPKNYVGFVYPKSGLVTRQGLYSITTPVDSGYRGELICILQNISDKDITIEPKQKVAQLVIQPVVLVDFIEVDTLSESTRGDGGFGSTGLK